MPGSSFTNIQPSDGEKPSEGAIDPRAVAEYIHDLTKELGAMAERARLPLIHYLLAMVRSEAEAVLRDIDSCGSRGGGNPGRR